MISGARHAGLLQVKANEDVGIGVEVGSDEEIARFCLGLMFDSGSVGAAVQGSSGAGIFP